MGLPRYLRDKLKNNDFNSDMIMLIGAGQFYQPHTNKTIKVHTYYKNDIPFGSLILSSKKYGIKRFYYDYDFNRDITYKSQFEKKPMIWFTNWEKINNKWEPIGIEIKVNNYFYDRAVEISNKRENEEKNILLKKLKIEQARNTEQGRFFKGKLRQIIMERDNYKCVLCGRGIKDGISLEVDHVHEWSDGGRTTYDNGQTVCSECNKGKHHAKKYNEKIKELKLAVS
ncbi:MAG: HNH endonuclease signature motif containing protein [Phycisphaerae bacterium]|jgi:5-methylcytosine-specific restriction endonuclease McrA